LHHFDTITPLYAATDARLVLTSEQLSQGYHLVLYPAIKVCPAFRALAEVVALLFLADSTESVVLEKLFFLYFLLLSAIREGLLQI